MAFLKWHLSIPLINHLDLRATLTQGHAGLTSQWSHTEQVTALLNYDSTSRSGDNGHTPDTHRTSTWDWRYSTHLHTITRTTRVTVISGALPLERATHRYTRALHTTQGHHRADIKAPRAPVSDGRQQLAVKAAERALSLIHI